METSPGLERSPSPRAGCFCFRLAAHRAQNLSSLPPAGAREDVFKESRFQAHLSHDHRTASDHDTTTARASADALTSCDHTIPQIAPPPPPPTQLHEQGIPWFCRQGVHPAESETWRRESPPAPREPPNYERDQPLPFQYRNRTIPTPTRKPPSAQTDARTSQRSNSADSMANGLSASAQVTSQRPAAVPPLGLAGVKIPVWEDSVWMTAGADNEGHRAGNAREESTSSTPRSNRSAYSGSSSAQASPRLSLTLQRITTPRESQATPPRYVARPAYVASKASAPVAPTSAFTRKKDEIKSGRKEERSTQSEPQIGMLGDISPRITSTVRALSLFWENDESKLTARGAAEARVVVNMPASPSESPAEDFGTQLLSLLGVSPASVHPDVKDSAVLGVHEREDGTGTRGSTDDEGIHQFRRLCHGDGKFSTYMRV